jgi:DnaK suppressor protein
VTTNRRNQRIAALRKAHLHAVRSLHSIKRERQFPDAPANADSSSDANLDRNDLATQIAELKIRKRLIQAALGRVGDGGYGICTRCEQDIDQPRLLLLPWAEYCIACLNAAAVVPAPHTGTRGGSDGEGASTIGRCAS